MKLFRRRTAASTPPAPYAEPPAQSDLDRLDDFVAALDHRQPLTAPDNADWQL